MKCDKIVFSVYPSIIDEKIYFLTLKNYGILTEEQINNIDDKLKKKLADNRRRIKLYIRFNYYIQKYAHKYGIKYINFDYILLNDDYTVKDEFRNVHNPYSIHVLWEPLIPHILDKFRYI